MEFNCPLNYPELHLRESPCRGPVHPGNIRSKCFRYPVPINYYYYYFVVFLLSFGSPLFVFNLVDFFLEPHCSLFLSQFLLIFVDSFVKQTIDLLIGDYFVVCLIGGLIGWLACLLSWSELVGICGINCIVWVCFS